MFCVDTDHAARMRQALANENADLVLENPRYVMRITGDDAEGQAQLGNFIDPEADYPVIVTTSRLLSTGVDAQTCRLIVIEREVQSMTEFKQIIGRGTRVHEDTKKYFFTLMDFRKASNQFADPDFDGPPVQIYEPGEDDPVAPPDQPCPAAAVLPFPNCPVFGSRPPFEPAFFSGAGSDLPPYPFGGDGGESFPFKCGFTRFAGAFPEPLSMGE